MPQRLPIEQALASVGPGWTDLVRLAHRLCTSEKFELTEIKSKFGRLCFVVSWTPETTLSPERLGVQRIVQRQLGYLEEDSLSACEACGAWAMLRTDGPVPGAARVLCDGCFARWIGGAVTWTELCARPEPGLSLAEAVALVGPGWRRLVELAFDIAHQHETYVTAVWHDGGRLVVSIPVDGEHEAALADAAKVKVNVLSLISAATCESCGAAGNLDLAGVREIHTLCAGCRFRQREGAVTWPALRGEWVPDAVIWNGPDEDDEDDEEADENDDRIPY